MHRTHVTFAFLLLVALVASSGAAQEAQEPIRLEEVPLPEAVVGTTTTVSRDVSQWVCLQRMPSSIVVPVNLRMSDQAERTLQPVVQDVGAWFELVGTEAPAEIGVDLLRVDQVWDVTRVGASGAQGYAFRVFCRVVLAITPTEAALAGDAASADVTIDPTLRNLGGFEFAVPAGVRTVGPR